MWVVLYNRVSKAVNNLLFNSTLKVNKYIIARLNLKLRWAIQLKQYFDEIIQHSNQWHHQIFIETSHLVQICQPIQNELYWKRFGIHNWSNESTVIEGNLLYQLSALERWWKSIQIVNCLNSIFCLMSWLYKLCYHAKLSISYNYWFFFLITLKSLSIYFIRLRLNL